MPVCSSTQRRCRLFVTEPKNLPSVPALAVIVITFGTSVLAIGGRGLTVAGVPEVA